MVVEQVELKVSPGREEECLKYLAATRGVIDNSKGCRSFIFGRGVEDPSKVMLVVSWDSLEAHQAAKTTPEFGEFSKTLYSFVTGGAASHFAVAGGA